MSPLEQRIAAITNSTANLVARLRELDELREQVKAAERKQRTDEAQVLPLVRGMRRTNPKEPATVS
jgi:glutaredoxin 2